MFGPDVSYPELDLWVRGKVWVWDSAPAGVSKADRSLQNCPLSFSSHMNGHRSSVGVFVAVGMGGGHPCFPVPAGVKKYPSPDWGLVQAEEPGEISYYQAEALRSINAFSCNCGRVRA